MDVSTTGCGTGAWVRVKTDFSPPKRGRFGDGLSTGQGRCACKNGFFTSYTGGYERERRFLLVFLYVWIAF